MHKNLVRPTLLIGILIVAGILITLHLKQASHYAADAAPSTTSDAYATNQNNNQQVAAATPGATNNTPVASQNNNQKIMNATLHTNKGDITIAFLTAQTPQTVANFIKLAQSGFYNGVKFHRVIKGFMIQGGDPLTKDDSKMAEWGTGGPGYSFNDELTPENKNDIGTIAMANSGPDTNGSQFFINVNNNNFLDTKHVVFGKVTHGLDVVNAISLVPVGPSDRPVDAITIKSVTLQ